MATPVVPSQDIDIVDTDAVLDVDEDKPVSSDPHPVDPQDVEMLQSSTEDEGWFGEQPIPSSLPWSDRVSEQEELALLEVTPSINMDHGPRAGMLRTKSGNGLSWGDAVHHHFTHNLNPNSGLRSILGWGLGVIKTTAHS